MTPEPGRRRHPTEEPGRRRHPTEEPGRRRHPTEEPGRRRHPTEEPGRRRQDTQEPDARRDDAGPKPRPPDVDTGFWLWMAALPLMVTAYVVDLRNSPVELPWYVDAISGVFVFTLAAIVVTFLLLMRSGYRWARTLLTGCGATSVVYVGMNLLSVDRPTTAAVVYAVSAIVGSVLIVGGIYLLHRQDVYEFFTR